MGMASGSSTPIRDRAPLLVFDIGGVFVGLDRPAREALLGTTDHLAPHHVERLAHATRSFRLGLIGEDDFTAIACEIHTVSEHTFYAAEDAFLIGGDPDMTEFLRKLGARHRVVAFSNTHAIHWRRVSTALLGHDAFHACYLSHEMGLEKPDRQSFEAVVAREGVHPEDIIFIDDTLANIEAAKAAGWTHAIHHRCASDTIAAIEAMLAPAALTFSSKTE